MPDEQIPLDFDGTDPEQQLRKRWHENAIRERNFWTPERRLLSWMQGTTPDDSDLRWLAAQPQWDRDLWLWLMDRETNRCQAERAAGRLAIRREFHHILAEFEETAAINAATDERIIERFVAWIREDFRLGRRISVSVPAGSDWRAHRNLDEAIRRAGIPLTSL